MKTTQLTNADALADKIQSLACERGATPAASIIIPVNAQGDLQNVLGAVEDIAHYTGSARLEIILVVNNYPADAPPSEATDRFESLGIRVVSIPNIRKPGEAPGFSARIPGIRAARSNVNILFDADCRVPNATALVDWYIKQFRGGAKAAYSPVGYYDFPRALSVRVWFALHHLSRWIKRNVFGIPTTRGSNYAVDRDTMLELYEKGMLADEMNVGPTFKAAGHRPAYSGKSALTVLTSGRMFEAGWLQMIPYFWYRLRYNLRTLPVRSNVAAFTGRENDPARRYVNNRPVR